MTDTNTSATIFAQADIDALQRRLNDEIASRRMYAGDSAVNPKTVSIVVSGTFSPALGGDGIVNHLDLF